MGSLQGVEEQVEAPQVPERVGTLLPAQQHRVQYQHVALLLRAADSRRERFGRYGPTHQREQELPVGPPVLAVVESHQVAQLLAADHDQRSYRGAGGGCQQGAFPRRVQGLERYRDDQHQEPGYALELQPDFQRLVYRAVQQDTGHRLHVVHGQVQRHLYLGPRSSGIERHRSGQHHQQPGTAQPRWPLQLRAALQQVEISAEDQPPFLVEQSGTVD